eukprot:2061380-Pyramimonas_sp.AAC.1
MAQGQRQTARSRWPKASAPTAACMMSNAECSGQEPRPQGPRPHASGHRTRTIVQGTRPTDEYFSC